MMAQTGAIGAVQFDFHTAQRLGHGTGPGHFNKAWSNGPVCGCLALAFGDVLFEVADAQSQVLGHARG